MKSFKQLFAIIFTIAVVTFGVLVMIEERDMFSLMTQLSFEGEAQAKITIAYILLIGVDVLLIALPALGFVLVLTGKYDPFKTMVSCALVVLAKFLMSIVAVLLIISAAFGDAIDWQQVFLGKDTMLIIPTLVFGLAVILLLAAKASNFEGSLARIVLAAIGSGLAIFGLVYYFALGGGTNGILNGGTQASWLEVLGLILGIVCFGGIVVYTLLPQTRDFKKAE